jgi:hydrogenase maturation protease
MTTLVLGLGNDLLSDDAVGIVAARALRAELEGRPDVVVEESSLAGLALLELFLGYDRAVILDSIRTGRRPPGSVCELSPADLDAVVAPSPHYAGLPEMLAVARRLDLAFPREILVLAVETEDPYTLGGGLSEPVRRALPALLARVRELLRTEAGAPASSEADHA